MIDKARNKKAFARVISLIFIVVLLISAIPTIFSVWNSRMKSPRRI